MKTLLWFTAKWCRPCANMVPVIDELQDDLPDLRVEKIDVEEDRGKVEEYRVLSLPTFVVLTQGVETARGTGGMPKSKLAELLQK